MPSTNAKTAALLLASVLATPSSVFAIAQTGDGGEGDGTIQFPTVTVTGWNFVVLYSTTLFPAVNSGQMGFPVRGSMNEDNVNAMIEYWQMAAVDPTKTNDARCNILVSAEFKNTTSISDPETKGFAAAQMFQAIVNFSNAKAVSGVITGSAPYNFGQGLVPTYTIIYRDGGTERYKVLPGPRLDPTSPVPGSLHVGSGSPQACPLTGVTT